mmetsp:Transcript_3804/g.15416  ORF Transcript_3804/g.15416 Transcript_3804/m.15416 type:complete len:214 (-) Transcript_3804:1419-2060(-)
MGGSPSALPRLTRTRTTAPVCPSSTHARHFCRVASDISSAVRQTSSLVLLGSSAPDDLAASITCRSLGTTRTRRLREARAKASAPAEVRSYGNAASDASFHTEALGMSATTPADAIAMGPRSVKFDTERGESVTAPPTPSHNRFFELDPSPSWAAIADISFGGRGRTGSGRSPAVRAAAILAHSPFCDASETPSVIFFFAFLRSSAMKNPPVS